MWCAWISAVYVKLVFIFVSLKFNWTEWNHFNLSLDSNSRCTLLSWCQIIGACMKNWTKNVQKQSERDGSGDVINCVTIIINAIMISYSWSMITVCWLEHWIICAVVTSCHTHLSYHMPHTQRLSTWNITHDMHKWHKYLLHEMIVQSMENAVFRLSHAFSAGNRFSFWSICFKQTL